MNEHKEDEVITFKEFIGKHKDIKEEELYKIVLVCKNCGHKDLLRNFLKERERRTMVWGGDDENIQPAPFKPSPFPTPIPSKPSPFNPRWIIKGTPRTASKTTKMLMTTIVTQHNYEDMFYCPKCGSSLVVLCREFVKNNVARLL